MENQEDRNDVFSSEKLDENEIDYQALYADSNRKILLENKKALFAKRLEKIFWWAFFLFWLALIIAGLSGYIKTPSRCTPDGECWDPRG
jgi:hypothetical protein